MKRHVFIVCIAGLAALLPGFKENGPYHLVLQFRHRVGNQPLQLFEKKYENGWGEPFVVNEFKYYISGISGIDAKGRVFPLPGSCYLVDEARPASKMISLGFPVPDIKAIRFIVGVDSAKNSGGVQTGVLDPAEGMFWTWNTGYIYAKLGGRSDSSHAPAHYFSYHIGGFRKGENAARGLRLETGIPDLAGSDTLRIDVDLLKWFRSVHGIRISRSPVCHEPGPLAMQVADNYSTMFHVVPVAP